MPSTATPSGEVDLAANLSDAQQIQRLRRMAHDFLAQLECIDGEVLLLGGYETWLWDTSREIQFIKESTDAFEDGTEQVDVVMHRPLRDIKPWRFDFNGGL